MIEHDVLARMRERHPDWIWHRADTHVFVAVPGTHESFKTTVEPGSSFSPGPGTYGVSTWVFVQGGPVGRGGDAARRADLAMG